MLCGNCQTDNPESSSFCGGCGHSLVRSAPVGLLGDEDLFSAERRFLTVMFCDLVGSTALSVHLDPELLHELVEQYHHTTSQIITRRGGAVAQYLGDGLLVYFGYPKAVGNDAERAVQTALEIIEAFDNIRPVVDLPGHLSLQARVGIHSGPVVTAELGRGDQRDRLALGDTPNIAARLESLAQPNGIAVSAVTMALTARGYRYADLGEQTLKGVAEPMRVFEPLGLVEERPAAGFRRRMIGRESELTYLNECLQAVATSGAQQVRIVGPSGIGKTRLIDEFVVEHRDDVRFLAARCDVDGRQTFLWPFQRLLLRELGQSRGIEGPQMLDQLRSSLGAQHSAAIAALVRLPRADGDSWLQGRPEDQKQQIFAALMRWMREVAGDQTLVLVLEDLHNSDASTREFLEQCQQAMVDDSVLFLVSERSDGVKGSGDRKVDGMVELTAMDELYSEEIVRSITEPTTQQLTLILKLAQGVPLFLQELAQLSSSGLASEISDRLQYIFAPKLDRLGSAKRTAIVAGVIGRVFDETLLGEVVGIDSDQLQAHLTTLIDEDVVAPLDVPGHFEFTHALLQDSLVANVLRRSRRVLHERVATVLQDQRPEESMLHPERLARHWNGAGDSTRALPHYLNAAEGARSVFANAEAIALCQDAIEMVESGTPDLDADSALLMHELRECLADVHALLRQSEEARGHLAAVLGALPDEDVVRRARMHRKIAALGRYDPPHGLPDMHAALNVLGVEPGAHGDAWRQEWLQVHFELAITHYARGDVEQMEAISEELEPFISSHGTAAQQAEFANQMLLVDCWRNRFRPTERAMRYSEEFVRAAEQAADLPTLAAACHTHGMMMLHGSAIDEAAGLFDRCLDLCEQCGYRSAEVRALMYYAVVCRRRGDLAGAAQYLSRGVDLARAAGMKMYEHTHDGMLSWFAYRRGDHAEAIRLGRAALDGWKEMGARYPFQWIATLPLLASAAAFDDDGLVLWCLEDLTHPNQQYLSAELMTAVEQAVAEPVRERYREVVAAAHDGAYL